MPLLPPNAVTQICSHQKDEYYINSLRGLLHANASSIFGNGFLLKWGKEINILADLAYYSLTTAGSLQTLGEEYTGLIQVDQSLRKIPSFTRRIVLILLHSAFPFLIDKCFVYLEKQLVLSRLSFLAPLTQRVLLAGLPKFKAIFITIHRLNLSLFYLKALYFTIAKRAAGVNYVKFFMNNQPKDETFSLLGKFSLAQATLMLLLQLYSLHKELRYLKASMKNDAGSTSSFSSTAESHLPAEQQKCALCLEIRVHTTAAPCGHLFCWNCIYECVQTKPECPLCRDSLQPKQLVCLKNY